MRILIVDDEVEIADSVAKGLRQHGFAVDTAYTGEEALDKAVRSTYDLFCLDVTMPGLSGLEVCQQLRQELKGDCPRILMLTAMSSIKDRVAGLDQGADDYLVKPFDFSELVARVQALLRRDTEVTGSVIELANLKLDLKRHSAEYQDGDGNRNYLKLTSKEYSLLQFFMSRPEEVFSQERLLEHNWDENLDPLTHTVRVTIAQLRKKLAKTGDELEIQTVVGAGYRLAIKTNET